MCSSIHHSTFTSPTLPLLCSKEKISKLILSPVGLYKFTLEHLTLAGLPATECLWFWLLELSVLHVLYTRLPLCGSKVAISDWELRWGEVPKTLKALLSSVGLIHIYTRCSLCLRFLFFHYFFLLDLRAIHWTPNCFYYYCYDHNYNHSKKKKIDATFWTVETRSF